MRKVLGTPRLADVAEPAGCISTKTARELKLSSPGLLSSHDEHRAHRRRLALRLRTHRHQHHRRLGGGRRRGRRHRRRRRRQQHHHEQRRRCAPSVAAPPSAAEPLTPPLSAKAAGAPEDVSRGTVFAPTPLDASASDSPLPSTPRAEAGRRNGLRSGSGPEGRSDAERALRLPPLEPAIRGDEGGFGGTSSRGDAVGCVSGHQRLMSLAPGSGGSESSAAESLTERETAWI